MWPVRVPMNATLPPAMPRTFVNAKTMSSANWCAAVRVGPEYVLLSKTLCLHDLTEADRRAVAADEGALEAAACCRAARGVGGRVLADGEREGPGGVEVVGESFGSGRALAAGERIEGQADLASTLGDLDDGRSILRGGTQRQDDGE